MLAIVGVDDLFGEGLRFVPGKVAQVVPAKPFSPHAEAATEDRVLADPSGAVAEVVELDDGVISGLFNQP